MPALVFSVYGNNNDKCEEEISSLSSGKNKYSEVELRALRLAVQHGDIQAIYELGKLYQLGEGVTQSHRKAFDLFEEAARLGSMQSQNSFNVGTDKEVKEGYKRAVFWYERAARQGNATAQTNLGRMYFEGRGVKKDYEEAFYWFAKAVRQENSTAQVYLGKMYEEGKGVKKDYDKALHWYGRAAHQGDSIAQTDLGRMYLDGKGVEKDYEKAFYWFKKAADGGLVEAFYHVGMMYANGRGVSKDDVQAYKWLILYDSNNPIAEIKSKTDESLEEQLYALDDRMTTEQVNEAQLLIDQFKTPFGENSKTD